MKKRKHQPVVHTQEQCDVWLTTTNRKAQIPANKRQRILLHRPISNITNITLSSQPIKAGTKQTNIQQFFGRQTAKGKENQAAAVSCASRTTHKTKNENSFGNSPADKGNSFDASRSDRSIKTSATLAQNELLAERTSSSVQIRARKIPKCIKEEDGVKQDSIFSSSQQNSDDLMAKHSDMPCHNTRTEQGKVEGVHYADCMDSQETCVLKCKPGPTTKSQRHFEHGNGNISRELGSTSGTEPQRSHSVHGANVSETKGSSTLCSPRSKARSSHCQLDFKSRVNRGNSKTNTSAGDDAWKFGDEAADVCRAQSTLAGVDEETGGNHTFNCNTRSSRPDAFLSAVSDDPKLSINSPTFGVNKYGITELQKSDQGGTSHGLCDRTLKRIEFEDSDAMLKTSSPFHERGRFADTSELFVDSLAFEVNKYGVLELTKQAEKGSSKVLHGLGSTSYHHWNRDDHSSVPKISSCVNQKDKMKDSLLLSPNSLVFEVNEHGLLELKKSSSKHRQSGESESSELSMNFPAFEVNEYGVLRLKRSAEKESSDVLNGLHSITQQSSDREDSEFMSQEWSPADQEGVPENSELNVNSLAFEVNRYGVLELKKSSEKECVKVCRIPSGATCHQSKYDQNQIPKASSSINQESGVTDNSELTTNSLGFEVNEYGVLKMKELAGECAETFQKFGSVSHQISEYQDSSSMLTVPPSVDLEGTPVIPDLTMNSLAFEVNEYGVLALKKSTEKEPSKVLHSPGSTARHQDKYMYDDESVMPEASSCVEQGVAITDNSQFSMNSLAFEVNEYGVLELRKSAEKISSNDLYRSRSASFSESNIDDFLANKMNKFGAMEMKESLSKVSSTLGSEKCHSSENEDSSSMIKPKVSLEQADNNLLDNSEHSMNSLAFEVNEYGVLELRKPAEKSVQSVCHRQGSPAQQSREYHEMNSISRTQSSAGHQDSALDNSEFTSNSPSFEWNKYGVLSLKGSRKEGPSKQLVAKESVTLHRCKIQESSSMPDSPTSIDQRGILPKDSVLSIDSMEFEVNEYGVFQLAKTEKEVSSKVSGGRGDVHYLRNEHDFPTNGATHSTVTRYSSRGIFDRSRCSQYDDSAEQIFLQERKEGGSWQSAVDAVQDHHAGSDSGRSDSLSSGEEEADFLESQIY